MSAVSLQRSNRLALRSVPNMIFSWACPIEDTVSHGIDEDEQSNLLGLLEHAMKSIATTPTREARFDTRTLQRRRSATVRAFS